MPPAFALSDLTVRTPTSVSSALPPALDTAGGSQGASQASMGARPSAVRRSRWATAEFRAYELGVLAGVVCMVWTAVGLGPGHANFGQYGHKLRQGWIPGRNIDVSDPQYLTFRSNLPALLGLSLAQLTLRHLVAHVFSVSGTPFSARAWTTFHAAFALVALSVMHGSNLLKILALVLGNYALSRRLAGGQWAVAGAWIYVGLVLVGTEKTQGFKGVLPAFLEEHVGLLPRWQISFNITALRLLSFQLDHHWARTGADHPAEAEYTPLGTTLDAIAQQSPSPPPALTEKTRVRTSRPLAEYGDLVGYVSYILYTPLYVAGPIVTFNNFASQMAIPPSIPTRTKAAYAVRFVLSLLCMEVLLHFIYVVALKDARAWDGLTAGELGVLGFWNLVLVWLKLLIPWRFMRLWALLDGVDPPENMVRCVANNYSCAGFWRSWHRSYNLWIVRYIYVPLGGASRPLLSTLVVFTFVALWHDLTMRLLVWGWLVTVVVAPEILAKRLLPSSKYGDRAWFRHAVALGGSLNVLTMCTANLIGFVLGPSGMAALLSQLWASWAGVGWAAVSLAGVWAAVQLMIEYREEERRHGVFRKY